MKEIVASVGPRSGLMLLLALACARHPPPPAHPALLVGSSRADAVRRVDAVSGELLGDLIPPGGHGLSAPDDLVIGPDGALYVSSGCPTHFGQRCDPSIPSRVLRVDPRSGALLGVAAEAPELWRPYGLAFAPDGSLYVASFANDRILHFAADGALLGTLDAAGPADQRGPGELNGPNDLLIADGRLYVTTEGAVNDDGVLTFPGLPSEILVYDLQTGARTTWSAPAAAEGWPAPSLVGMAVDDGGRMFVTDYMSPWLLELDGQGQVVRRTAVWSEPHPPRAYTGAVVWDARTGPLAVWGDDGDVRLGGVGGPRGALRALGEGLDRPIGVVVVP
jgi:sugar lactone lactonase YvrE